MGVCLRLLIVSMQRSGSTTLCDDLNRFGIPCWYELFNFNTNPIQAGYAATKKLGMTEAEARANPRRFIDRNVKDHNFTEPCVVAFKVFNGQLNGRMD